MAQTREGAEIIAAKKAGVPLDEYRRRKDAGEKWCTLCRDWHPLTAFGSDRSRYDGLSASCLKSRRRRSKEIYEPRPGPEPGRSFVPARDGDRRQARRRVNYFVEAGLIPPPNDLPCADCGHVWEPGERRHEYDHHLGYAAEHHESVEPVCTTCHVAREMGRA